MISTFMLVVSFRECQMLFDIQSFEHATVLCLLKFCMNMYIGPSRSVQNFGGDLCRHPDLG